ncbi:restriction endonuclease subunit S [Dactylosporangium sp. NPDC051541]|uniref:restriction endonuclease subunit S n=1 Tax=Dactylosporangium sp. NPDC051541 TaxID=3363977 RepID=UPI0037BA3586
MDSLIGQLPDGWQVRTVKACCQVISGPSGTTLSRSAHVSNGIPVLNATDIGPHGIIRPEFTVSEATAQRLARYELARADVVFVRVGLTTRHATVADDQAGWLLGGSCVRIRVVQGLLPGYLPCYLSHPAVREWVADHTRPGVKPSVNNAIIGALPLVIPPVAVQQDILEVASAIDTKIRAHEDVIRGARELRELLLPRLIAGESAD